MSELQINVPNKTHQEPWKREDWRYCWFMGGRGNGRSGTASRYLISKMLSQEYVRGAMMRAVRENIRESCWRDYKDRMYEYGLPEVGDIKLGDKKVPVKMSDDKMVAEIGRNSLRAFGFRASSGSLTARLKSLAKYNLAWIEEMEEIGEDEFRKFDDSLRTKDGHINILGTTNPPPRNHWLIEQFFDLEPHPEAKGFYIPHLKESRKHDTLFIHGTYRENAHNMDSATIERYKRYKETNPNYYWHQIEGLVPETVQGRIYEGWKEIDDIPHEARLLGHFLDFGGGSAPDAIGSVYYLNGGYIVDERYYKVDNSYDTLIRVCQMLESAPIVADAAEDRMVKALQQAGVNILTTDKGPGSVAFGIKHVQGLKISYTRNSPNLKREYENYAWLFDKDGNNKDVPDPNSKHKYGDHLMDGLRYFAEKLITAGADPEAELRATIRAEIEEQEEFEGIEERIAL